MSETAKVLEISKKAKPARFKVLPVDPTMIVDVWSMVWESLRNGVQPYPDLTEDQPEVIRSHLFNYLQGRFFQGLIAYSGKRPIGVILGDVRSRPFGRPKIFVFIYCLWVSDRFRKQGIGKSLFADYISRLKKAGIFHWEAQCSDALLQEMTEIQKQPIQRLMNEIGGRIP